VFEKRKIRKENFRTHSYEVLVKYLADGTGGLAGTAGFEALIVRQFEEI